MGDWHPACDSPPLNSHPGHDVSALGGSLLAVLPQHEPRRGPRFPKCGNSEGSAARNCRELASREQLRRTRLGRGPLSGPPTCGPCARRSKVLYSGLSEQLRKPNIGVSSTMGLRLRRSSPSRALSVYEVLRAPSRISISFLNPNDARLGHSWASGRLFSRARCLPGSAGAGAACAGAAATRTGPRGVPWAPRPSAGPLWHPRPEGRVGGSKIASPQCRSPCALERRPLAGT
jgi:hypothetical protein